MVIALGAWALVLWDGKGWDVALYRSFITVSSAGIANEPTNNVERLTTVVMVLVGVSLYLLAGALVFESIASRVLSTSWRARRQRARIGHLAGHHIVCGYGRVGQAAAQELKASGADYLVIELEPEQVASARANGELVVEGDATDPLVLEEAGLARANGLIVTLDTDAENLYVVLVANERKPELLIAARASSEAAAAKLKAAGADRLVSPYESAGRKLAAMALNPQLENIVDLTVSSGVDLRLAQIEVSTGSWAEGRTLQELGSETRAKPVAMREPQGVRLELDLSHRLVPGDVVIGLGGEGAVALLEARCHSN